MFGLSGISLSDITLVGVPALSIEIVFFFAGTLLFPGVEKIARRFGFALLPAAKPVSIFLDLIIDGIETFQVHLNWH